MESKWNIIDRFLRQDIHTSFVSSPSTPVEPCESVLECLKLKRTDIFCCFSMTRASHWLFIWSYGTGLAETGTLATCLAVSWTWRQTAPHKKHDGTQSEANRHRCGLSVDKVHTDSISWLTVRTSDEAMEPDVFLSDWDPLCSKMMSSSSSSEGTVSCAQERCRQKEQVTTTIPQLSILTL